LLNEKQRYRAIATVAAIAFLAKLALALNTYGTNDVYTYERFGLWSRYFGAELYKIAPDLNHPPSMLHLLRLLIGVGEWTHLGFAFCIRFPGIVADAGTVWLICRILGPRIGERSVFWAVLLIAASPTNILVSGFHGNTDPVMIFFVLLMVWLVGYRDRAAAGGVAFGIAFCIKIAPVVLMPVLFFALKGVRRKAAFFAAAGALVLVAWAPYLYQEPVAVFHQVFGYKSSYGLWGVSWLLRGLANAWPASQGINSAFSKVGSPLVMAGIVLLSIRMSFLKKSLYAQAGMVFLFFFTATSGFAVQYMVWLVPWLAELGVFPVACFVLTGSVFLLVVYNYWNLGMPWYMAIAYPWSSHQYFQVWCWASVILLAIAAWCRMRYDEELDYGWIGRISPVLRASVAAALAVGVLFYPAVIHMKRDAFGVAPTYGEDVVLYTQADELHNMSMELARRGRAKEASEVDDQVRRLTDHAEVIYNSLVREQPSRATLRTPEDYVDASLQDYNTAAYPQCVYDATESLKGRPGMPAALNNITLCQAEMGNWDAAIVAAREGVRVEPESAEARQNLDYVLAGKNGTQLEH
jgi:hypothetical protein